MTATAVAAHVGPRSGLLAAAVLVGQLSVGWSNDAIDADRDRTAGRTDKPIATGVVPRRLVAGCAGAALLADVPLSLALGARPGIAHLLAVAAAWSYNAGVKRTVASPAPYMVAFALVPPVVVAGMLPGTPWPRLSLVLAAAGCGVAGHFANTVGDTTADALTGVRGLPQRIGPVASTVVAGALIAAAAVAVLVAVGDSWLPVTAVVVDVAVAALLPLLLRSTHRQTALAAVLVAVTVLAAAFIGSGGAHLSAP